MIDHTPTAVSFHGFAGAFAVALWEQGIQLKAVIEPGGFGVQAIEANRHMLGFDGPIHTEADPPIYDADILVGNPPCSGFSTLNPGKAGGAKNFRGSSSPINNCMWAFVRYAARMNQGRGPLIAAFESVQQAGTQGRELMESLAEFLRNETGESYVLHHLFMSGASVGAAQVRRRYFWVATRVPFGIESPNPRRVVTYQDAIGDLIGMQLDPTEERQIVHDPATWWTRDKGIRVTFGVDGHMTGSGTWEKRLEPLYPDWHPGETHREAFQRLHARGHVFEGWTDRGLQREIENIGYSTIFRIRPDEPGRVITGSGGAAYAHYSQDRTLTVRETARLMGFPDWFDWGFVKPQRAFLFLGKQVPVQSWSWLGKWIHASLTGEPGRWTGYEQEEGSRKFDVTRDFQQVFNLRTREHVDSRPKYVKDEMENRPA